MITLKLTHIHTQIFQSSWLACAYCENWKKLARQTHDLPQIANASWYTHATCATNSLSYIFRPIHHLSPTVYLENLQRCLINSIYIYIYIYIYINIICKQAFAMPLNFEPGGSKGPRLSKQCLAHIKVLKLLFVLNLYVNINMHY